MLEIRDKSGFFCGPGSQGKIYSSVEFWDAKIISNSSYTWHSIVGARELVKHGSSWVIGDGRSVRAPLIMSRTKIVGWLGNKNCMGVGMSDLAIRRGSAPPQIGLPIQFFPLYFHSKRRCFGYINLTHLQGQLFSRPFVWKEGERHLSASISY